MQGAQARAPIPADAKLPDTISASFAATGRGWRHPTFTCRRPAPGRKARWPKIQEARCDRFRRGVSNAAEPATAERHMAGSSLHGVRPAGSDPYGRPQLAAGHKSPRRGCRKATLCGGLRYRSGALHRLRSRHPRPRRTSPILSARMEAPARWRVPIACNVITSYTLYRWVMLRSDTVKADRFDKMAE